MSAAKQVVEPVLPVRYGPYGGVHLARGVRAGRWVFASGQMGQDATGGIDPDVMRAHLPQRGEPKRTRESMRLYDNVEEVLHEAGTELRNTVRLDQYYRTHEAVDPYHLVRHARFDRKVPPSTSIVMRDLLVPDADVEVQFMAIVPDRDFAVRPAHDPSLDGPPESGYPMGLSAGDYIFLSGNVPSPKTGDEAVHGIATKARMRDGSLWWGQPIHLEADYVIGERMKPALEQIGSSLEDVVKMQVYLTHNDEAAAFNQIWARHFPHGGPATTIVPCPPGRLGVPASRIEINMLALRSSGATRREIVEADVFPAFERHPVAVRAGDLLLVSGLMAVDAGGLVERARVDPRVPRFGSSAQAQAEHIIESAQRICEAAGTTLANVVRIQQFHTDLDEFYPVHKVWQRYLPGLALPCSAVGVPGPLPVPGCTLLMDLWFYAP